MSKDKNKKDVQSGLEDIHIDYENINVEDIMEQIKKKIAGRPKDLESDSEPASGLQPFPSSGGDESGEAFPPPSRMKTLLLKLTKPFSPVVKFLILPVYQELRETVITLDKTNKRLDQMGQTVNDIDTHSLTTSQKLDQDMPFLKEYTRLLYNLAHNTVIEMTKLKIEEENIKIRLRILEKDFENLKSRGKALESRIIS